VPPRKRSHALKLFPFLPIDIIFEIRRSNILCSDLNFFRQLRCRVSQPYPQPYPRGVASVEGLDRGWGVELI
jgi:hypothetical protein